MSIEETVFKEAVSVLKRVFSTNTDKPISLERDLGEKLQSLLRETKVWAQNIQFFGLQHPVRTESHTIPLNFGSPANLLVFVLVRSQKLCLRST